jgi:transposase-like protein
MTKTRRNGFATQGRDPSTIRLLPFVDLLVDLREGLRAMVTRAGLGVLSSMLEQDRIAAVGARYARVEARRAYRAGTVPGELVLGGRKVKVVRPRVRSVEGREVPLATYEAFRREDPLAEHVMAQMLAGVSTRGYEGGLEAVGEGIETRGVRKSSVSRQFVRRTQAKVDTYLARSLKDLDLPVLMLDGIEFAGHLLVVALGIDTEGRKHVLGIREGSTENAVVCKALLAELVERGLDGGRWRLVVIDGSKALRRAVVEVFGRSALIQRCQIHKLRNVLGHLPEGKHAAVRAAMKEAYRCRNAERAKKKLLSLAGRLQAEHPGAAASLREGLEETLTVLVLRVPRLLERSLATTNPIESLFSRVRTVARNVKRWRGGSMVVRWAGAGAIEASRRFRRLKGFRNMSVLLEALRRHAGLVEAA